LGTTKKQRAKKERRRADQYFPTPVGLYLKPQGVALQQKRSAVQDYFVEGDAFMRIIEGWKKIDNERGYLNVATGQNLIVSKKQFGQHYLVLLFPEVKNGNSGRKISNFVAG
jgi:hypothetical protein